MGGGSNGIDLTTWENKIVEKVSQKIALKTKITRRKTNPQFETGKCSALFREITQRICFNPY